MLLEEEEQRWVGGAAAASAAPPKRDDVGNDDDDELECGICCLPYDRCGRAPRRLGAARGSWKPSRCRHVICSACVCQLAREGWWEEVTCPYCRHVTSLRERASFLVAGVRRGSGAGRRRLVLPPIDAELWHRVVRLEEEREEGRRKGPGRRGGEATELPLPPLPSLPPEEEGGDDDDDGPGRFWRALKRLLKGGGGGGGSRQARRGRSRSLPPRRRPPPLINPYGSEMKDLALMTCYII